MKRKRPLGFFETLEAIDNKFFDDLEAMLLEEKLEQERLEAYWAMRRVNAEKARRIYPRLKWLEDYSVWEHTKHIVPDFFGNIKERKKACKALHEHREIMRAFYRALYNYWMFDIPIPWATKWMGLKYSRHRKYLLKAQKRFKRGSVRRNREKRRQIREERKALKERLRTKLQKEVEDTSPMVHEAEDFPDGYRVLLPVNMDTTD